MSSGYNKRDQRDDDNSHRTGIIAQARSGSPALNRIAVIALQKTRYRKRRSGLTL
jgi:hypothetical protein